MTYINGEIEDIYFQNNILCLYHVSIASFIFSLSILLIKKIVAQFDKKIGDSLKSGPGTLGPETLTL